MKDKFLTYTSDNKSGVPDTYHDPADPNGRTYVITGGLPNGYYIYGNSGNGCNSC